MSNHAAATAAPPSRISHHEVITASASPATQATAKQPSAAASTCRGRARPEPTSRTGPTRRSSVPRIPSL